MSDTSEEKKLRYYTVVQGGLQPRRVTIKAERVEEQANGSLRFYSDDELIGVVKGEIDAWWLSEQGVESYEDEANS